MNPLPSEPDPLDPLLRTPLPPLPGEIFAARVMAALPPSRRSPISPLWWVLAGAAAGTVFAWMRGASWSGLADSAATLASAFAPVVTAATDPSLILALSVTALSLLLSYAIHRQFGARGF